MRRFYFLLLSSLLLQSAVCHKEAATVVRDKKPQPSGTEIPANNEIMDTWTVPPAPHGNDENYSCILRVEKDASPEPGWQKYLEEKLVLDTLAADSIPPGTYQVIVHFVVDKTGRLTDVKVDSDPGYGLGAHTARVIAAYDQRWVPGQQNGRAIKCYRRQPITFVIEEDDCEDPLPGNVIL